MGALRNELVAVRGWWLLSALGGLLIAVGQPSRPVLAVGAFEGSDDALAQQVRQQVVQTLSLSSRLHISDREHARAILQEQRLRETGLTGESEASAAPLPAAQVATGGAHHGAGRPPAD
jgi:hypothetical protein